MGGYFLRVSSRIVLTTKYRIISHPLIRIDVEYFASEITTFNSDRETELKQYSYLKHSDFSSLSPLPSCTGSVDWSVNIFVTLDVVCRVTFYMPETGNIRDYLIRVYVRVKNLTNRGVGDANAFSRAWFCYTYSTKLRKRITSYCLVRYWCMKNFAASHPNSVPTVEQHFNRRIYAHTSA